MLSELSFWIFLASALGFVVGVGLTIKSYRDAKYASYFFLREEAALRVKRLLFVLISLAVVIVFLGLRLFGPGGPVVTPVALTPPTPEVATGPTTSKAAASATVTAMAAAAMSPSPSTVAMLTVTPTTAVATILPASPTNVPSVTLPAPEETTAVTPTTPVELTPMATVTAVTLLTTTEATTTTTPTATATPTDTPVIGRVTPRPDAAIRNIIFSRGLGPNNKPKEPTTTFSPTDDRIFAFFEYHGMTNGVAYSLHWMKGGQEIGVQDGLWNWGTDGRAYMYYTPVGGYTPGQWELRIYVGDRLMTSASFEVK